MQMSPPRVMNTCSTRTTAINSASLNDNEEMINDNWYDLQGRRIAKPTKAGLYIKNGKKMVINNK